MYSGNLFKFLGLVSEKQLERIGNNSRWNAYDFGQLPPVRKSGVAVGLGMHYDSRIPRCILDNINELHLKSETSVKVEYLANVNCDIFVDTDCCLDWVKHLLTVSNVRKLKFRYERELSIAEQMAILRGNKHLQICARLSKAIMLKTKPYITHRVGSDVAGIIMQFLLGIEASEQNRLLIT